MLSSINSYGQVHTVMCSLTHVLGWCRLCEGSEITSLLSATVEGQPAGRTVLLQAAGSSFFALQPFLKALQRCHHPPLAHHIIRLPTTDATTGDSKLIVLTRRVPYARFD